MKHAHVYVHSDIISWRSLIDVSTTEHTLEWVPFLWLLFGWTKRCLSHFVCCLLQHSFMSYRGGVDGTDGALATPLIAIGKFADSIV